MRRWQLEAIPRPHMAFEVQLAESHPHSLPAALEVPSEPPVAVPQGVAKELASPPCSACPLLAQQQALLKGGMGAVAGGNGALRGGGRPLRGWPSAAEHKFTKKRLLRLMGAWALPPLQVGALVLEAFPPRGIIHFLDPQHTEVRYGVQCSGVGG